MKWVVVGTVIIIGFFLYNFVLRKFYLSNIKPFQKRIVSDGGHYVIYGQKKHFKIKKDRKYIFEVKNGQIVSVKKRSGLIYKKYIY